MMQPTKDRPRFDAPGALDVPPNGILFSSIESDALNHALITEFRTGLKEHGWTEGLNFKLEFPASSKGKRSGECPGAPVGRQEK
jgi:hypothetical protein